MGILENKRLTKGQEEGKGWGFGYFLVICGIGGIALFLFIIFSILAPGGEDELFRIISYLVIFFSFPPIGIVTGFFYKNQASKIAIFTIITFVPIIWIGSTFFVWVHGFMMGAYPEAFLRSGFLGGIFTPLICLPIIILLFPSMIIGAILGRKFDERKLSNQDM
jgi:hypothetical protein